MASRVGRGLLHAVAVAGVAWGSEAAVRPPSRPSDASVAPVFRPVPQAQLQLEGVLGARLSANVTEDLLPMLSTNPMILEMLRQRRAPVAGMTPWAGEAVGKYLIAAVLSWRMDPRPALRERIDEVVNALESAGAEDGYLGPFPPETRLIENWDLWGHYHAILGLVLWHEASGNARALRIARRAADRLGQTFLDGDRRAIDVGAPEANLAIIHALARLYRHAREPRHWQMIRELEKDWERSGDYFRTGWAGLEFFQIPRPRWEGVFSLQGLGELYRLSGDEKYRTALINHWQSILRSDRRNTGGFSSQERATGNPYAPTPVETCATVGWMALTADVLAWTGWAACADELELSTLNAAAGAQHPSGRWWTYSAPMDGVREASTKYHAHQSLPGGPGLNCCALSGPRSFGLLADWAVMQNADGLVVNYYGPGNFQGRLADQTPVAIKWETTYPLTNQVHLRITPLVPRAFTLRLRVPAWSEQTRASINEVETEDPLTPGQYWVVKRRWESGDRISLQFDFRLRFAPGEKEAANRVCVYRGPLLLAWDQGDQAESHWEPDSVRLSKPQLERMAPVTLDPPRKGSGVGPWVLLEDAGEQGSGVRLRDFATAGMRGTRYRTWLLRDSSP